MWSCSRTVSKGKPLRYRDIPVLALIDSRFLYDRVLHCPLRKVSAGHPFSRLPLAGALCDGSYDRISMQSAIQSCQDEARIEAGVVRDAESTKGHCTGPSTFFKTPPHAYHQIRSLIPGGLANIARGLRCLCCYVPKRDLSTEGARSYNCRFQQYSIAWPPSLSAGIARRCGFQCWLVADEDMHTSECKNTSTKTPQDKLPTSALFPESAVAVQSSGMKRQCRVPEILGTAAEKGHNGTDFNTGKLIGKPHPAGKQNII